MTFIWKSEYLEQYARGEIIVNAGSIEEARNKAIEFYEKHDKDVYDINYIEPQDEIDKESISIRKTRFLNDISAEPFIINDVYFIYGSA